MKEKTSITLKDIWNITNPSKKDFSIGLFCSILSSLFSLMIPLLLKQIMDNFTKEQMINIGSIIVIVFLLNLACSSISIYVLSRIGESIIQTLRMQVWNKLLKLPINYYDKEESGKLISRVTNDTTILRGLISRDIIQFITNSLSIVVSIGLLFYVDITMTLILLITVPLIMLIVIPLGKKMSTLAQQEQQQISELTSFLSQMLGEMKLIKSHNTESQEIKKGKQHFNNLYVYGMKRAKIYALLTPILGSATLCIILGIAVFGVWKVNEGSITIGTLIAFLIYFFQILMPFMQMNHFITSIQVAKGATNRLFQILQETEEEDKKYDTASFIKKETYKKSNKQIEFKNIHFQYENRSPLLQNLSFSIQKGNKIAIVGPSGSGKSTIFSLLERFYEPTSGEILLNGISQNKINKQEWRKYFSYVSQSSPMLSGTIKDNILYGITKNITEEELIATTKRAYAHDFIMNLPNQYETDIGEKGSQLSGGQKQRLAIARALLRNTEILLFDEATSNLDSESESHIQETIKNFGSDKTIFIIAHRLSTILHADKIFVLEDGIITGCGTHEELFETHLYYRKTIKKQLSTDISFKSSI
ncbi:ABC transporter ATP-binding protein [Bacillus cereus]|uniref:ABC transporter ATP-binding protein n=1 Tax=Bacillus cereus TaxID=1396 RepID=UPI000C2939AB|nr:ABC transporter ATP-binding protein [Bacillus cereus]